MVELGPGETSPLLPGYKPSNIQVQPNPRHSGYFRNSFLTTLLNLDKVNSIRNSPLESVNLGLELIQNINGYDVFVNSYQINLP